MFVLMSGCISQPATEHFDTLSITINSLTSSISSSSKVYKSYNIAAMNPSINAELTVSGHTTPLAELHQSLQTGGAMMHAVARRPLLKHQRHQSHQQQSGEEQTIDGFIIDVHKNPKLREILKHRKGRWISVCTIE